MSTKSRRQRAVLQAGIVSVVLENYPGLPEILSEPECNALNSFKVPQQKQTKNRVSSPFYEWKGIGGPTGLNELHGGTQSLLWGLLLP